MMFDANTESDIIVIGFVRAVIGRLARREFRKVDSSLEGLRGKLFAFQRVNLSRLFTCQTLYLRKGTSKLNVNVPATRANEEHSTCLWMKAEHRERVKGERKMTCEESTGRGDAGTRGIYRCRTEFNAVNGGEVASDVRPHRLWLGRKPRVCGDAMHRRGMTGENMRQTSGDTDRGVGACPEA